MSSKIKLCGLFRECDIEYANEAQPDYIGFIIDYPKSHRSISPELAKRLKQRLNEVIQAVGVFVDAQVELPAKMANEKTIELIQLHGNENNDYISRLRKLTDAPIIKAIKIASAEDIFTANETSADFILLDSGKGSGVCFDHSLINPDKISKPFFIAGGLTPDNLSEVIREFQPFGVDLSGGIETDRLKDREKMLSAVRAAERC